MRREFLNRGVELALSPEGNPRIQISDEAIRQAKSRAAGARLAFLPNLEGSMGEQSTMRSLATLGVGEVKLPFKSADPARGGSVQRRRHRAPATQNIFDFSSVRRHKSARAAARHRPNGARRTGPCRTVAKAHVAALRAEADMDAVRANVDLADAVLKQAEGQKNAGSGKRIEATRAKVQLSICAPKREKEHGAADGQHACGWSAFRQWARLWTTAPREQPALP